jgi:acyl carrier protein
MNRVEVLIKVQDIFRDVFDDPNLVINDLTDSNDIGDWDSLNHINLIMAVEKQFKIKFTFTELASLKDVGTMVDLIVGKK